jgi:steroid 5-alpha reductase family enzyme
MSVVTLLLWGTVATCSLMFLLWLIHFPMRNAAIVDFGWAGGLALLGGMYAVLAGGFPLRTWLIGGMSVVWGLRLAFHLLFDRILGHPEEGRYQQLRKDWKTNLGAKFLAFYLFQALLDVALSIPFLLAARNPAPRIAPLEWLAVGLWIVAVAGESLADRQLAAFKARPESRGRTCRAGLWRYSRHPNYFFEWLIWVSFALFALASPDGYWGLISPALILYFLLRVTGIPATEEQAVRTRGDDYRDYQRTTSAFIPWFPKENSR